MNHFDRMPGPGARGHDDGLSGLYFIGTLLLLTLVLLAAIAIVILLWNSFKVRAELRTLRGEVARLTSGDGPPVATQTALHMPGVNHGQFAVPPTGPRPPAPPVYAVPPGQGRVVPPPYVAPADVVPPPYVAPADVAPPAPAPKAPAPKAPAPKAPEPKAPEPKAPAPKTSAPKTSAPKTPAPKTPRAPRKKPGGPTP